MVLIYSKDVDDFVNNVIDYLNVDFFRIGEHDKVAIESMNFSNELFYNLWRIAVRVILPLSIIVAIFVIIGQGF